MKSSTRPGNLFVISGPSGVGKGTLVQRIAASHDDIWVSVSMTTRKPREGEVDGVHYLFTTEATFLDLLEQEEFLEWAQVHDAYYGTPRTPVENKIACGKQVILEIDTQGAFQVRERFPKAVLIFIEPPSMEELRRRLELRGSENPQQIERRLRAARVELSRINEYDVVVRNDDLDCATHELKSFIDSYVNDSPVVCLGNESCVEEQ